MYGSKIMLRLALILVQAAVIACIARTDSLYAATMASADTSGGYAAKVLEKVLTVWAPPPALKSNFEVRIKVSIDEKGNLQDCTPTRRSGLEALDTSACGSVKQVAPFASPPDGKSVEVHMVFWTGMPKGKFREQPPSPEEAVRAEIRARAKAESMIGTQTASSAESAARQRAEAVAIKAGKPLPEIDETLVAPPAKTEKSTKTSSRMQVTATIVGGKNVGDVNPEQKSVITLTETKKLDTGLTSQSNIDEKTDLSKPEQKMKPVTKDVDEFKYNKTESSKPGLKNNMPPAEKKSAETVEAANSPNSQKPSSQLPADIEKKEGPQNVFEQKQAPAQKSFMLLADSSTLPQITNSAYLHKIRLQIMRVTYVPAQTKPGEYNATVKILLDGQGNIKDSSILRSSGSNAVDSHIMRGISRRNKVSPPPGGVPATCEIKIKLVHPNAERQGSTDNSNNTTH